MTLPATLPVSKVDFSDPVLQRAVGLMGASNKCSYLLPLAAWQRGLTVEFFGTQADARVQMHNMPKQSPQPELFRISDGQRQHFFNKSMGDANTVKTTMLASNKAAAKECFAKAGIATPKSAIWTGVNAGEIRDFLAKCTSKVFVIKPLSGSLRQGVMLGIPASQVIVLLSNLGAKTTLVEEQIKGLKHRIYVVGDQAIAAHAKPGVSVTGNGRETIAQLIKRKNQMRAANPALASCQIDLAAAVQYLAEFGQSASRVPVLGERVVLSTSNNMGDGGDAYSVIDTLSPIVARASVAACAALNLPNGAVDIIFDGQTAYVLEVNERAQIGGHSFPTVGTGSGNVVAEAIVDWYFPTPDGAPPVRHTLPLDNTGLLAEFARNGIKGRYTIKPLPQQQ